MKEAESRGSPTPTPPEVDLGGVYCQGNPRGARCYFYYKGRCCHSIPKFWWFLAYKCGFGRFYYNCIGGIP